MFRFASRFISTCKFVFVVYEYHYKDHLGNLRVAFQAKEDGERERFSLTMENDKKAEEEKEFENVAAARSDQKDKEGHYSAALEGSKQAISKTIAVKKGDRIQASVFATHDPIIAETDPTKAIEEAKKDVLLSLGGVALGSINTNPTQQKIEIPVDPEISPAQTIITKTPKVQLNLLDFVPVIRNLRALNRAKKAKGLEPDTYFVPKGELVLELRDSTDSLIFERKEKLTISSVSSWEKLVSNLDISQDGKLSVYIDNSSSDKVYFDNFEIERTEATIAVVVQENHYYPFGMNMKGIEELDIQSLDGTDEHRWQFNGVEKNESFGLNWNETFYRTYDMQLGRWNAVDAKPTYSQTTYMGMGNNPVSYSDALGDTLHIEHKGENIIYNNGNLTWGSDAADGSYKKGGVYNGNALNKKGKLKGFVKQVVNHLAIIASTSEGSNMINELSNSSNNFSIKHAKYNPNTKGDNEFIADNHFKAFGNQFLTDPAAQSQTSMIKLKGENFLGGAGGTIYWNTTVATDLPTTDPSGISSSFTTSLAHELFHGLDANRGLLDDRLEQGLKRSEWQAVYRENNLRSQLGLPLRTHYGVQADHKGNAIGGAGVRTLTTNNTIILPHWYRP